MPGGVRRSHAGPQGAAVTRPHLELTESVRTFLGGLLAAYMILLVWIVVFKLQQPSVGPADALTLKLVPFIAADGLGSNAPRELLANVIIFVPLGVLLGAMAPKVPWWTKACAIVAVSVALECAQFALAVGASDLTDVLMNGAGGLIGLVLVELARFASFLLSSPRLNSPARRTDRRGP